MAVVKNYDAAWFNDIIAEYDGWIAWNNWARFIICMEMVQLGNRRMFMQICVIMNMIQKMESIEQLFIH